MTIENKIKLYNNSYVKGECRSNEYEARIKQEKRRNIKLDLADTICNELPFTFQQHQKNQVKQLINTFPNFKELHSKSSNEEIILSFIFYVKSLELKNDIDFNTDNITKLLEKQTKSPELFHKAYNIIKWKITLHYVQKQPILPHEPEHIDHNILYKG